MITFTRAPTVKVDDPILSSQFRRLARAFNDRIRSGVADSAWRICMYWFNLFRQVRNPDDSGLVFPSQAEFFEIYQQLDPEYHQGTTWPVAGPGEPEGANLANPMMQFVFGIDPALSPEDRRLNLGLPFFTGADAPTLEDLWELGKAQRGAYDPITGAQNVPAFDAAQTFAAVTQPYFSPHGKSYGGWLPQPVQLTDDCGGGDPLDIGYGVPSFEIFFTALRPDVSTSGFHGTLGVDGDGRATVTYAGTCPCGSAGAGAGQVLAVVQFAFAYHVYVNRGTGDCSYDVDRFPLADWVQGPYGGEGALTHTDGLQVQRSLWAFGNDFRGTPAQRTPDDFVIEDIGFDFQAFFTRQYYLAPNTGFVSGDSVEAIYPRVVFKGSGSVERFGTFEGEGATVHPYSPSFVMAGVFAKAVDLFEMTAVEFLDGEKVIARLRLKPDDNGVAMAMLWLDQALHPNLRIRLPDGARFKSPAGSIVAEATEQLEYKPQFWDAYLITRMGGSQGGEAFNSGVDGRGLDDATAKQISDDYFGLGCINSTGVRDIAEWVNDNPVYDTARRLSREQVRIMRRQQLVAYEVGADGKSVLYFKRFAFGLHNLRADCFVGIAPPIDPVEPDGLVAGETYIVRGGANHNANRVTYLGSSYHDGQTFVAVAGRGGSDYQAHGDAAVFVHDGIKHAALEKGFTNDWVMFLQTKCYHPSATSVWKPEAYGDYYAWNNRCHFYSGTAPGVLRRFMNYNYGVGLDVDTFRPFRTDLRLQATSVAPEAPPGYNYAAGANTLFGGSDFYSSCQIYEAPFEIESCTVDDPAPDQIIKVVLKTRLRSHPAAPATVAKDPLTWSAGDIDTLRNVDDLGEKYRTPDNALREYVLSEVNGNYPCTFKIGDAGTGSAVSGLADNPFGSCHPHFFFTKLVPEPFEDDNDSLDDHDTRATIDAFRQMEVYLRAMCEGFIDQRTSQDIICRTGLGNLYDYAFENLCFDAFSGRWIGAFSLAAREDGASGFGPLPDTLIYAEVFNRLSGAVNRLDKARIDLPIKFYFENLTYQGTRDVALNEIVIGCSTSGTQKAYGDHLSAPPADTLVSSSGPFEWFSIGASKSCQLFGCPWELLSYRQDARYYVAVDPDFVDAVPAPIQDLIDNGQTGFIAQLEQSQISERREITDVATSDGCCLASELPCPGFWFESGNYYRWVENQNIASSQCVFVNSGVLEAPPLLTCDYKVGRSASMAVGSFCANGPSSSAALTLIAEQGAFIQVPIVDAF